MNNEKIARELVNIARILGEVDSPVKIAKEKRIDIIRRILKEHQHEEVEGMILDVQTAKVLETVYKSLRPSLQAKFEKMDLKKMADFAWSMVG